MELLPGKLTQGLKPSASIPNANPENREAIILTLETA